MGCALLSSVFELGAKTLLTDTLVTSPLSPDGTVVFMVSGMARVVGGVGGDGRGGGGGGGCVGGSGGGEKAAEG